MSSDESSDKVIPSKRRKMSISTNELWIKVDGEQATDMEVKGTTVGDVVNVVCPSAKLDCCRVSYKNTVVGYHSKLSQYVTTPKWPLEIQQRIYYIFGNEQVKICPCYETCWELFLDVADNDQEDAIKLIGKYKGSTFTKKDHLRSVKTSCSEPMRIDYFYLYVEYEDDGVEEVHCIPTQTVNLLVKENFNQKQCIAFFNTEVVKMNQRLAELSTSVKKPLVLKDAKLDVKVDGKNLKDLQVKDKDGKVTGKGKAPVIQGYWTLEKLKRHLCTTLSCSIVPDVFDKKNSKVDDLMNFICKTQKIERTLYFSSSENPQPSYTHKHSVSNMAKPEHARGISAYSEKYELYMHWFSLKVYNKFNSDPDDAAINFVDQCIKKIIKVDEYQPKVFGTDEMSYTSIFFRSLDRYLFPDATKGCVIHQPVIAGMRKNKPDGYCAKLNNSQPVLSLLASDMKVNKEDFEIAELESLGYCQSIISATHQCAPLFVMPCTLKTPCFSLSLCWPIESGTHALIEICTAESFDTLKNFFCALKYAIDEYKFHEVNRPFVVEPIQGTLLRRSLKLIDAASSRASNIYLKDDEVVYKLFDMERASYAKPNSNIITQVLGNSYLSDIYENYVSEDSQRYKYLKYKYIPNRKEDNRFCLEDFLPIKETLQKLHNENYVHSDVRLQNMVFPETGSAKLIDFDLTDKENTPYPHGYNTFHERHKDATANRPRQRIHDTYSLIYIILDNVLDLSEDIKVVMEKFLQDPENEEANLKEALDNESIPASQS